MRMVRVYGNMNTVIGGIPVKYDGQVVGKTMVIDGILHMAIEHDDMARAIADSVMKKNYSIEVKLK